MMYIKKFLIFAEIAFVDLFMIKIYAIPLILILVEKKNNAKKIFYRNLDV